MLIVFQQKHLFYFCPQRIRNGQLFLLRIRITHEIIFSPVPEIKITSCVRFPVKSVLFYNLYILIMFLRIDQIQDHSDNKYNCYAVIRKNAFK